jgi:hypothetical protein
MLGIKSTYRPIYLFLEKELAILQEYIIENTVKGFIQPSVLKYRYFILFIPKPRGKL